MARDLRTPFIPIIALSAVLAAGLALPPLGGQEQPEKPEQTALSPWTEPFEHKAEPVFAVALPKAKKFDAVRERWRQVDLSARKTAALANIEQALAAEQAKEPKDEQRIIELQSEKAEAERFFARSRFQIEVEGKPGEVVRIEVFPIEDRKTTLSKIELRKNIETKWTKVQVLRDQDLTTKAQKGKGQEAHTLVLYGTPENEKERIWVRFESRLIPSKDDKQLFLVRWIHTMPEAAFDKASAKEDELLSQMFIVP